MFKKSIFTILFTAFLCSLFAQQRNTNISFEGIWSGDDEGSITSFIFRNNILIMANSGDIVVGTFTYNDRVIQFSVEYVFFDSDWEKNTDYYVVSMEYKFSGSNLIVISDGDQILLTKIE